ncbi:MAG: hypothetical protein FD157_1215 [Rhodocyclaceae bacterium]|nr:MAG: hypothetical protein FD157_1215 [Rhodocyclaceae bacterium]TND02792.1 MAG: hypothetical protein FD118_1818 [Rhodocyclaceae bacterium]
MVTINAKGQSGHMYPFQVFPFEAKFNPVSAVYIFLRDNVALYIGKAKDLSNRMSNHHKEDQAKRLGANRIAVLQVGTEAERDRIERDLIMSHQPTCNEQLK